MFTAQISIYGLQKLKANKANNSKLEMPTLAQAVSFKGLVFKE